MISEESFRLFSYVIRVGSWTNILPYTWNPADYTLRVVRYPIFWRVFAFIGLFMQWVLVPSAAVSLLEPDATVDDSVFFLTILFSQAFSTMFQIYNLCWPEGCVLLLSTIHTLARRLAAYYPSGHEREEYDGEIQ